MYFNNPSGYQANFYYPLGYQVNRFIPYSLRQPWRLLLSLRLPSTLSLSLTPQATKYTFIIHQTTKYTFIIHQVVLLRTLTYGSQLYIHYSSGYHLYFHYPSGYQVYFHYPIRLSYSGQEGNHTITRETFSPLLGEFIIIIIHKFSIAQRAWCLCITSQCHISNIILQNLPCTVQGWNHIQTFTTKHNQPTWQKLCWCTSLF